MPHAHISEGIKCRAKSFRREMTKAERRLWYALRAHRFGGLGFRRQVPPFPPCGGARSGKTRAEGGYSRTQSLRFTPFPTVFAACSIQESRAKP
ncbi:MAG TPA: DUF559 domain-containing protein [Methyloceanibacter sp.]|nr:DUF559 domain-containing protein [Methyloceanibacter sp.]